MTVEQQNPDEAETTEPTIGPDETASLPVDDIAALAVETDEGPDALDVPDEDPGPPRYTGAREDDGEQDVSQAPEGAV